MTERLQKIIADCGITSRRKAEELIRAGRVRVNGNTAKIGDTADREEDVIEVDGVRVRRRAAHVTYMLCKPRGYVTTVSDEKNRKTVLDLFPEVNGRLYPVGRLDMYSEGLLLMTDDGDLAQKLTHPKQEIPKTYHLWVSGYFDGADLKLRRPIEIDGRRIAAPYVTLLDRTGATAMLEVVIHEGRNRQIRRMCEAAGLTVTRLRRVKEGELSLGNLKPGEYRLLTEEEQEYLNRL